MVALVTGGGRGIGRAIALRLASEGWRVAITARSADQLAETAALKRGAITAIPADVSHPADVSSLMRRAEGELGPVDLLVNNAGTGGPMGAFWENDPEAWWRCLEVNLRGPMLLCREVMPGMVARRSGRIVNIASGAGTQAFPNMSAYVASKTALVRFSEQLAMEAQPFGVRVFPVGPGMVRTAMLEDARVQLPFLQKMLDDGLETPPEAAADLILRIARGHADALSGRFLSVWQNLDDTLRQVAAGNPGDAWLLRLAQ
jgi:NAD(P)-dependent dehydrogenase (short-subunit alcohol dehydrogenase family)